MDAAGPLGPGRRDGSELLLVVGGLSPEPDTSYPKPEAMRGADVAKLLVLNIAYWYVPALLIPAIATIARRFPLDSGSRVRPILAHVSAR